MVTGTLPAAVDEVVEEAFPEPIRISIWAFCLPVTLPIAQSTGTVEDAVL